MTGRHSANDLIGIAEQFSEGPVNSVREYGSGNINDTYMVTSDPDKGKPFILQRINTQVFHRPELVMTNMRVVTEHMQERLRSGLMSAYRRWEVPTVLRSRGGRDYWIAPDGSFWRAIAFIGSAQSYDVIEEAAHGREVGYALGMFHGLISDLPAWRLADTLEGFHITPRCLRRYEEVLAANRPPESAEVSRCVSFVDSRKARGSVLEDAKAGGLLRLHTIHGDPKANNVLIDTTTAQAVSIVDLDTVKPGLLHYDIGDCLRSACNPLGEETERWEAVRFEPDLCEAVLQGYLSQARPFLTDHDYAHIYEAVRVISIELGLRFFTDYLEGNVYFKASNPGHNLARALVQFRLVQSIEAQENALRALIRSLR
jgi:Ser/Thr protein kinase RdoA (MazF antagonist)